MPKAVMIDPAEVRSKRVLSFSPIPLNQYDRSLTDELASGAFTKADLVRIQRDMMIIRAFEEMLDSVKKQGHYKDIAYNHRGPAHLSIGQEASAVGQAEASMRHRRRRPRRDRVRRSRIDSPRSARPPSAAVSAICSSTRSASRFRSRRTSRRSCRS